MTDLNTIHEKECATCKNVLDLGQFHKNKACSDGRRMHCKTCLKAKRPRVDADRDRDRDRSRTVSRRSWAFDYFLRRCYGIDLIEYAMLFNKQGQRCAACLAALDINTGDRDVHLDHNHSTGAVRGIVCKKCNSIVGLCGENPVTLARIAQYIRRHDEEGT